eukprot:TRINITY_DN20049_c0_g2_i3.p1 TRINITY_DN20049_c0_g2~~TRINITY_DN20049_c0_g2_i3.p1  ORF type:complete len:428 (+),score=41.57 TRINITY_DN20049_c0_g2_i3:178-1284(+)
MGDSSEKRQLAARQRDVGYLSPGDPEYDAKMTQLWGGPPMRWFPEAMREWPAKYDGKGKVALITGCTGGIGFYVAKLMAACGYTVIVPARPGLEAEARDTETAIRKAVPNSSIIVPSVPLDLRSFQSVRDFASDMKKTQASIDVLCLNAGRGGGSSDPREATDDGHEAIVQVNTTSHFLLVAELFPLIQASTQAKVIAQSSGARFNANPSQVQDLDGTNPATFNAWSQYSLSKACMCTIALALNDRLRASNIQNVMALACEPGLTSTGVNIQHDLAKTLGFPGKAKTTNDFHDLAAHHAADGALPMVLACLLGQADDFFEGGGRNASSLSEAAFRIRPDRRDPMCWPKHINDAFWQAATQMTGARWPF